MKKHFSRILAAFLALMLGFGILSFFGLNNKAFADSGTVYMVELPRGGDPSPGGWGHPAMNFQGGWYMAASDHTTAKSIGSFEGDTGYCLEPGVNLEVGDILNSKGDEYWDDYPTINSNLTPTQIKEYIGRIFMYGWTGQNDLSWNSGNSIHAQEIAEMLATQYLVWETIVGDRDADFNWVKAPGGTNNIIDILADNHPLRAQTLNHYFRIAESVKNHMLIPSFMDRQADDVRVYELLWDNENFVYSLTLTDENHVLNDFDFHVPEPFSYRISGNQLIITLYEPPVEPVTIKVTKKSSNRRSTIIWTDSVISPSSGSQVQDIVSIGSTVADPITGYAKIMVATSSIEILKMTKNNDGLAEGFDFEVRRNSWVGERIIGTYTTDVFGKICLPDLPVGPYIIQEINVSDDFVMPVRTNIEVEIKKDQGQTVLFVNTKKLGIITVEKSNADPAMGDYSLEGAEFTVLDVNGEVVDTIITDANGRSESKPLPLGEYTVFESKAPCGFVVDKTVYSRTLSGSLGTEEIVYCPGICIAERPQTGQIKITKVDEETGATLTGAAYDLFDSNGNLIERLYSNNNSSVISQEHPLGSYIIKETFAPKDYILAPKEYPVTLEYAGQETSIVMQELTVENRRVPTFVLPKTGSDGMSAVRWVLLTLCGSGFIICLHLLKKERKKEKVVIGNC